ncbi:hybrid sensor histidine kinase/response regulator [Thermodesulforhabdus norvegica]|uniref:histidine kinase n=1 Tax=Thermodesulforhabdus norvegica TaxID=39841 RepID=A0A1I4UBM6_9BACT|nr:PAS domain-containing sensor histidine kinase [Thermodesulforhabdus norvegica]SFM86103.1 PAS domain S-box-containing protein [Thermodesulforhabdus norvegica]
MARGRGSFSRDVQGLYREVAESIDDVFILTDEQGGIIEVLGRPEGIFGRSLDDIRMVGNIGLLLGKNPSVEVRECWSNDAEHEVTDMSGAKRTVVVSAKRVSFGNGMILYRFRDRTRERLLEDKLSTALAQLSIYMRAPVVITLVDRDGRLISINSFGADRAGKTLQQLIGAKPGEYLRCPHHLTAPDGCGSGEACRNCVLRRLIRDTFESKKGVKNYEVRFCCVAEEGASENFFLISTAYMKDNGGEGVLLCLVDITDYVKKKSAFLEALRESEHRYRQLFNNPFTGIALYRPVDNGGDFVFVDFNETAEKLTGKSRSEVLGRRVTELFPGIADMGLLGVFRKVHETGEARYFPPSLYIHPTGERRWYENYVYKLTSGEIVALFVDCTPQKLMEEEKEKLTAQLYQAEKMESIGRFAGSIAHDFNNMLNVILGYGEMILHGLGKSDPLREMAQKLVDAAKRSAGLTEKLMTFSRKRPVERQVIDINDLILGMEDMLRRLIGEQIELELNLSPSPALVCADPNQMEQVVMNLAVNACDAMPQGGKLLIETAQVVLDEEYAQKHYGTRPGSYVMLAVTDTGCGMSREMLDRIFEPFFTTKEKGTGLGLSTVYGIVKGSGGNIWVYSEPGRGTTFKIYLPQAEKADRPKLLRAECRSTEFCKDVSGKHILVVEDEDLLRKFLEEVLNRIGCKVTVAADPKEAISLVEEKGLRPDLLLTDLIMPRMNGKELAYYLKSIQPNLKVIYMSGYTDNSVSNYGMAEFDEGFLQKPFTVEELALKIREAFV